MTTTNIRIVRAKSCSGRDTLVGYAIGSDEDIKAYFDKQSEYGLYLEPLKVVTVTPGYAERAQRIKQQVRELRKAADDLERELVDM